MATLTTTFSTFSSVTRSGSIGVGWTNTSDAQTSNNARASLSTSPSSSGYTNYIQATGLTDALPAGAVVTGIKVVVERRDANNSAKDSQVKLVIGGTVTGTDKADTSTTWPSSDAVANYGGSTDMWGTTPTLDQLNASDFGVVISVLVDSGLAEPGGGL